MITLLVNPTAGSGRAKKVVISVIERLKELDLPHRIWETTAPGEAKVLAEKAALEHEETPNAEDMLLSIGGDGTFLEVVQGALGHDLPVASLPAGTGNDFLKSLKVPADPMAALEHILNATVRKIDIGKINHMLFANECGAGFDVAVLDYANQYKKVLHGLAPYLIGVIRSIFSYKSAPMAIFADGKEVFSGDCLVFSVANGAYIGGGIHISPEADVQSGKLQLIIVKACSRLQMVRYLPGLMKGKILQFKDTVVHCKANRVQVKPLQSDQSFRVNIDGEICDMSDCDFSILPRSLSIHM